eukprot:TRINITY_DN19903_c0_g1_i2.p1 TRINITY_DN19903_c0_g1~~TRINITY_DN19903_c0_g1_i2.p1  ORF type:complete len:115 (-),score=1.23 TRINITY_DN19903_c0_g1_i2:158-502(-)
MMAMQAGLQPAYGRDLQFVVSVFRACHYTTCSEVAQCMPPKYSTLPGARWQQHVTLHLTNTEFSRHLRSLLLPAARLVHNVIIHDGDLVGAPQRGSQRKQATADTTGAFLWREH